MNRPINSTLIIIIVGLLCSAPVARAEAPLYFGWSSVTPHAAEYTGDGHNEMGLFDAATGMASVRKINGEELVNDAQVGLGGYQPAFGDNDGDALSDPASYNPASGIWYSFLSGRHYQLICFQGVAGQTTTTAHPMDYDGDRMVNPVLYDSLLGIWAIYLSAYGYQPVSFILGGNGAVAVPADYDGDGKTDSTVYDKTNGLWGALCPSVRYAYTWFVYGGPGCEAALADFDGYDRADIQIENANTIIRRWDAWGSTSGYGSQKWAYQDCYGTAGFEGSSWTRWACAPSRNEVFPHASHGENDPLTYTVSTNYYAGICNGDISTGSSTSKVFYYIGGQVYLKQDCMHGEVIAVSGVTPLEKCNSGAKILS